MTIVQCVKLIFMEVYVKVCHVRADGHCGWIYCIMPVTTLVCVCM